MSPSLLLLAAAIGFGPPCAEAEAAVAPPAELTVVVHGLDPAGGNLMLALYDEPAAFDARHGAIRRQALAVTGEIAVWRVEGLRPGPHALLVFQDLDLDGELDRNRLGVPVEPYGFSTGARRPFGPPSFKQARFELKAGEATISVEIR